MIDSWRVRIRDFRSRGKNAPPGYLRAELLHGCLQGTENYYPWQCWEPAGTTQTLKIRDSLLNRFWGSVEETISRPIRQSPWRHGNSIQFSGFWWNSDTSSSKCQYFIEFRSRDHQFCWKWLIMKYNLKLQMFNINIENFWALRSVELNFVSGGHFLYSSIRRVLSVE